MSVGEGGVEKCFEIEDNTAMKQFVFINRHPLS